VCPKQIRPKLDYQFSLARKMELVDAVQEIAMVDATAGAGGAGGAGAVEWLSEEYQEILRDQEQIR
jgi:cell division GTPase FtsZ